MKITKLVVSAGLLGMFALFSANASAMIVTFDDFDDANDSPLFYDISTNVIAGNTLTIGLSAFEASGAVLSALDTLSFTVAAPAGFKIVSIEYDEHVMAMGGGGVAIATGSMVVNGVVKGFGTVIATGADDLDLGDFGPTPFVLDTDFATVSITNSLFAFGGGMVLKDLATVTVEVAAIPLPAPLLLMGSALAGLFVVRRRSEGEVA